MEGNPWPPGSLQCLRAFLLGLKIQRHPTTHPRMRKLGNQKLVEMLASSLVRWRAMRSVFRCAGRTLG